jgi:predicted transglutaminase-like cysteine proteinase
MLRAGMHGFWGGSAATACGPRGAAWRGLIVAVVRWLAAAAWQSLPAVTWRSLPAVTWRSVRLAVLLVGGAFTTVVSSHAWDPDRIVAAAARLGPAAVAGAQALQAAMVPVLALNEADQVAAVNSFYNRRVVFREDAENWGQNDYWASPLESLNRGAGDCEDYAISKYATLVALGVTHSKLRLVYVRAMIGGPGGVAMPHMVLAYYPSPGAEPLILDNLIHDVRSASLRPDLAPVFSFNAEGLWQGSGTVSAGDPLTRLSKWQDVLAKTRLEGFL